MLVYQRVCCFLGGMQVIWLAKVNRITTKNSGWEPHRRTAQTFKYQLNIKVQETRHFGHCQYQCMYIYIYDYIYIINIFITIIIQC